MNFANRSRAPLGFQTSLCRVLSFRHVVVALLATLLCLMGRAQPVLAGVEATPSAPAAAAAATNALQQPVQNGLLVRGFGDKPLGWRSEAWSSELGTSFGWNHEGVAPGVLLVRNPKPNDARWVQSVPVQPERWYGISGFVRARKVIGEGMGASLSTLTGYQHSREIRGEDSGWQAVSLFVRTGPGQHGLDVTCRLGTYGRIASGEASCTGVEVVEVAAPPAGAAFVYSEAQSKPATGGLPAATAMLALLVLGLLRFTRLPESMPGRERTLLWSILGGTLALKCLVAPFFAYQVDIGTFTAWATRLSTLGPAGFYETGYFADYPPGYMYVLWGVGLLADSLGLAWNAGSFRVLLKLPALFADAAVTLLIFVRLRPKSKSLAWVASLSFLLNPALIVDSTIWGQTDSVLALLVLLALFFLQEKQIELGWAFAALAVLTKPQALLLVPLLVLVPPGWWRGLRPLGALLAVVATIFVVAEPFRGDRPWSWLIDLYFGTTGYYAETSVNAMNLPALLFGMRASDAELVGGLTRQAWGFILGGLIGLPFFFFWFKRQTRSLHIHLLAAAALVAFCCLTRMHERYLYPFFPLAALLGPVGLVGIIYWTLSALFLTNELVVYAEQASATAGPAWLWMTTAVATVAMVPAWLVLGWRAARGVPNTLAATDALEAAHVFAPAAVAFQAAPPKGRRKPAAAVVETAPAWSALEIVLLVVLTGCALALRLWEIGSPGEIVFDEVYFVEQARNYLTGKDFLDPHPPFAKLMIALSQWIFGDEPRGWRIANALSGTALVPLAWVLARRLFHRRILAGFAGLMITIDGLFLVDSRIAVIDIHYVTWAVLAYVLTLGLLRDRAYQVRSRLMLTGAVIGISVGAKLYIPFFSFLLVLGTIAFGGFGEARRLSVSPWRYLRRPILTVGWTAFGAYLLTFLPHFLWGWWTSPFDFIRYIAIEVPEYQAAVAAATHPYSSNWWTWPLLLRPIWYFWKDPGPAPGMVVGIWGSGNPALWWASVPALIIAGWHAVRERRFDLGFVVVGWAIHLAPWIPIGRTLFLYHYLPSLFFALLALAWLLDRLWQGEGTAVERGLLGLALGLSLAPVAGAIAQPFGLYVLGSGLLAFEILTLRSRIAPILLGRTAVTVWTVVALLLSWYFLPIWMGTPLPRSEWEARMWHTSSAILSWI